METEDPVSKLIDQSLADPEVQRDFREIATELVKAATDPNNQVHHFLKQVIRWSTAYVPTLSQSCADFHKPDARADQLLKQMEDPKMSLKDFLSLDPIDPHTLLLIARKILEQADDDSKYGQTMRKGRKKGTLGSIAKAVAKHLKKHPGEKAADIWKTLTKKPPKGLEFMDNSQGQYIEYVDKNGLQETSYRRFCNIVSEQRKVLKTLSNITE
jgi:hypothetical protein